MNLMYFKLCRYDICIITLIVILYIFNIPVRNTQQYCNKILNIFC